MRQRTMGEHAAWRAPFFAGAMALMAAGLSGLPGRLAAQPAHHVVFSRCRAATPARPVHAIAALERP